MGLFDRKRSLSTADPKGMPAQEDIQKNSYKPIWVVLGLANPGQEYIGTRHNVGAEAVMQCAFDLGLSPRPEKGLAASVASYEDGEKKVILALSNTYMNESGLAARDLKKRYELQDLSHLVIVHDELDIEPGYVKIKLAGGTAGHNGLKSIQTYIGSPDFARIRIGIGKPAHNKSGANHVLGRPGRNEREILDIAIKEAASAINWITDYGISAAMNKYNTAG